MTQQTEHLTRSLLADWADDSLSPDEIERVESHLMQCEECAQLLDEREADVDPLVARLRSAYAAAAAYCNTVHTLMAEHPTTQAPAGSSSVQLTHIDKSIADEPAQANAAGDTPETDSARSMKRWEPVTLLGAGGIGEVWEANDHLLGRRVAVKRLRYETAQNASVQKRFLYEARITAQLNHPGTVHVLDLIENGPESYYVMSLIQGDTLREAIETAHTRVGDSNLPLQGQLLPLLRHWIGVAQTIAYAHSEKILHRDLKSENVIVGSYGQVTVIDWGLAKRFDDAEQPSRASDVSEPPRLDSGLNTQPGVRLGTPSFMAPEQASGRSHEVDERTDVWGLAAILHEILTGEPPFVGCDSAEIMNKVISQPAVSPSERDPSIPIELSDICLKGLEKDPEDRYQSVTRFTYAVEDWMNTESTRRESEEFRHRLFDISDDLMVVFNDKPEVLWVNSAWTRILGWQPEDLLGKQPNIVAHPDEIRRDFAILKKLAKGEIASGHERRTQTKDGGYRWYSWSLTPVPEEGIICAIGRDIDARLKREEEYLSLLNAAPDAMVVINSNRSIYMVNDQLTEMFGYERDELIGEPIEILLPERYRDTHAGLVADYINSPEIQPLAARDGVPGLHKNGDEFEASIRISPVTSESATRYVASIRRE